MNNSARLYINDENEYFIVNDASQYRLDSFIKAFNNNGTFEQYHDIIINDIVHKYFRKLLRKEEVELYTSLSEKDLSKYYKFPSIYDLAKQYIVEELLQTEDDLDEFTTDPDNFRITPQHIVNESKTTGYSNYRIGFIEYASGFAYQNLKRLLTIYDSKKLIRDKSFDVLDYVLTFLKNHLSDFYYKKVLDKEEYEDWYIFVENEYAYSDYYDMIFNTDYLDNLFNKPWIDIATSDNNGDYKRKLKSFIGVVDENKLYTFKNHQLISESIDAYMLTHYDAKLVEKESED